MRHWLAFVVCLGFGAAVAAEVERGGPATRAVTSADAELGELVKQLGDPKFGVREQAQKRLSAIPLGLKAELERYLGQVSDEEVKIRLQVRIGEMEEELAINPRGISLELKDANLETVANGLGRAMGKPVYCYEWPGDPKFTLKVSNQPLWEVIQRLSEQHGLWVYPAEDLELNPRGVSRIQVKGGLAVAIDGPWKSVAGANLKYTMDLSVAADPRIPVLAIQPLVLEDARDDGGGRYVMLESGRARLSEKVAPRRVMWQEFVVSPKDASASRLTIKGEARVLVQISEVKAELRDATKHLNEAVAIGDNTMMLKEIIFSPADQNGNRRVGFGMQIVPNEWKDRLPPVPKLKLTEGRGVQLEGPIEGGVGWTVVGGISGLQMFMGGETTAGAITQVRIVDAKGEQVAEYSLPRDKPVSSVHISENAKYTEPLTVMLSSPQKVREVRIPFEFRDLPVGN